MRKMATSAGIFGGRVILSFDVDKKWYELTEDELNELAWQLRCLSFDANQLLARDKLGLLRCLMVTAENRDYWLARAYHAEGKVDLKTE